MRRLEWTPLAALLLIGAPCLGDAGGMMPDPTAAPQRPVPNAPGGSGVGVPGGSMSQPGLHADGTPRSGGAEHPEGSVGNPSSYREPDVGQQRPVPNAPSGGGVNAPADPDAHSGQHDHPEGSIGNPSKYGSEAQM